MIRTAISPRLAIRTFGLPVVIGLCHRCLASAAPYWPAILSGLREGVKRSWRSVDLERAARSAGLAAPVRWDEVTGSTNATAASMAREGAPEWTLVGAGHQTAGPWPSGPHLEDRTRWRPHGLGRAASRARARRRRTAVPARRRRVGRSDRGRRRSHGAMQVAERPAGRRRQGRGDPRREPRSKATGWPRWSSARASTSWRPTMSTALPGSAPTSTRRVLLGAFLAAFARRLPTGSDRVRRRRDRAMDGTCRRRWEAGRRGRRCRRPHRGNRGGARRRTEGSDPGASRTDRAGP